MFRPDQKGSRDSGPELLASNPSRYRSDPLKGQSHEIFDLRYGIFSESFFNLPPVSLTPVAISYRYQHLANISGNFRKNSKIDPNVIFGGLGEDDS